MSNQSNTGPSLPEWMIYTNGKRPQDDKDPLEQLPAAPPWREFGENRRHSLTYQASDEQIRLVNAALYLRRPLLVTGRPGVGKSSLAYSVAEELGLGRVLRWTITSRTTLNDGLYRYDAIGRMQEAQLNPKVAPDIGKYLTLGPLGTAMLPSKKPRALLIDEIDKSDIDLPNDLLNIFEEGEYEIPELARIPKAMQPVTVREFESDDTVEIEFGRVRCSIFPFVVMTSNGERDFPAPFLRRCLRLEIKPPTADELAKIVEAHLKDHLDSNAQQKVSDLIADFVKRRDERSELLANDQLLNAVFMLTRDLGPQSENIEKLKEAILKPLGGADTQ